MASETRALQEMGRYVEELEAERDKLVAGLETEIQRLDDLCRLYLRDEGHTAEQLAQASDRLQALLRAALEVLTGQEES